MNDYCVTSTPTICDGTVIRWYRSELALVHGDEAISASRNGVTGHNGSYLTPELFQAAWDAHRAIKAGEDVGHLVTHRSKHLLGREYVSVSAS